MPHQEGDISWQVLRRIVQDWAGTSAELSEVAHLDGGSISTTLLLTTTDGAKAVLKISPYRVDRSYESEAHDLDLLRPLGIPTPKVYQCITGTLDDPNSYLLMEFKPGVDLNAAKQQCTTEQFDDLQRQLAELVCAMHSDTGPAYGRLIPDGIKTADSWPQFFREVYEPTWHEVQKLDCLPIKTRKLLGKLHERLDRFIAHGDVPRLVHWDLWASNILSDCDDSGQWRITAVLDPICKYAHAEAELAYLDLFHTITPTFTKAYQQQFKLDEGYHRVRKPIYQLYPLLNHVCTFGNEYLKPTLAMIDRVSALV
jgi:fructosamine-3-kinase